MTFETKGGDRTAPLKHCPETVIKAWETLGNILSQLLLQFPVYPSLEKNLSVSRSCKLLTRVASEQETINLQLMLACVFHLWMTFWHRKAHPTSYLLDWSPRFSLFRCSEGQRLILVEFSQFDLRHNFKKQRGLFPARMYWTST